ncbi:MAG: dihydrodipicolinate synthase family protein [Deltaproteobacteria bacterium]|nr:MAG: dihydrodipicolinate synthase family protein [Deltaproteobacteria bacterium]
MAEHDRSLSRVCPVRLQRATSRDVDSTQPSRERLTGVFAPVLTPFDGNLAPDARRLARHCKWLLSQGLRGLAVFGTTSEANSLSVDERESLLEALLGSGIPPGSLLPGTGCSALTDTVRLTRAAVRAGCASVLVLPPFYYKAVTDEGLFRSFAELIERVGDSRLRVYLYHIPPIAQVGFSLGLVERLLAAYPDTVVGMKDSSGDIANTRAMIDAFAKDGFEVFSGSERFLLETLKRGGVGCITATANVNPAAIDRLYREWRSPEAESLQSRLNAVRNAFEKRPAIPALKAVVAHYAKDPAWRAVRPPLLELGAGETAPLVDELRETGFEMPL